MGIGTGAQVQAWEEVRKLPKDQPSVLEDEGSSFWSWLGCASCCDSGRRRESTAVTSASTGESNTDKSSFTVPPSEQTIKTDMSAKSDATDSSMVSKTDDELMSTSQLRRFSFNDLKSATRNFRPDSLLGEGGFGCVFKGWIDEHGTAPVKPGTGLTVAVKTLNQSGLQGHREWLAEITFLGQLHHPNLVNLVGFCMEDSQRLLVYEFMQRGSLENHLFRKGALPLPWNIRMKIALGAAKGLEFLHSGKKPVIYRDFKTSNILLDMGYMAKLSDFGLAKDGPQGGKSHVSTRVMGTLGYAAPEYVMTGHLTSKSDVYSFGVVLLEMLTGKRSLDKNRPNGQHNLTEWARPYLSDRRKISKIIDPRLEGYYSVKGSQKAGQLAHRCLSRDPKARPSMTDVVEILGQVQNLSDMASTTHPPPVYMGAGTRMPPSASVNGSLKPVVNSDPSKSTLHKPVKGFLR